MHTSSPSPYSPSPTRRSLSPSPALLAPSGATTTGFTPPSPLRGRTQSFGSSTQGPGHGHHHAHVIHSSSTTSLPTRSNIHPTTHPHAQASLQQVRDCVQMFVCNHLETNNRQIAGYGMGAGDHEVYSLMVKEGSQTNKIVRV